MPASKTTGIRQRIRLTGRCRQIVFLAALSVTLARCADAPNAPLFTVRPVAGMGANAPYTATMLGTLPGGDRSEARGINHSGAIVGQSTALIGGLMVSRAVRFEGGQVTDLGTLPGDSDSEANDVNDAGYVVGLPCSKLLPAAIATKTPRLTA